MSSVYTRGTPAAFGSDETKTVYFAACSVRQAKKRWEILIRGVLFLVRSASKARSHAWSRRSLVYPKAPVQRLVPSSRPDEQEAGEEIKSSEGTSININFHKFLVLWQPLEDFSSPFSTWTMSKLAKLNGKWREHRKFPLSLSLHRLFRLLSRSESQHGLYRRKEKLPKLESEAKEKKIVE